jgi:AraC-like DNA-binding protein
MHVKLFLPKVNDHLISEFWEMKCGEDEIPAQQMVPPFGTPELIFYIGSSSQIKQARPKHSLIKGQYTLVQAIQLKKNAHLFGIRLRPQSLYNLLGIDMSRIIDSVLDGKNYEFMTQIENLLNAGKPVSENLILEIYQILLSHSKFKSSDITRQFLDRMQTSSSNKINDILKGTEINIRSLQRNFTKEVGLSPKKYLRLIRVNQIEKMFQSSNDWIEVVTHFNLADQSHLIREIKTFRQHVPTEIISKKILLHQQLPHPEVTTVDLSM